MRAELIRRWPLATRAGLAVLAAAVLIETANRGADLMIAATQARRLSLDDVQAAYELTGAVPCQNVTLERWGDVTYCDPIGALALVEWGDEAFADGPVRSLEECCVVLGLTEDYATSLACTFDLHPDAMPDPQPRRFWAGMDDGRAMAEAVLDLAARPTRRRPHGQAPDDRL